MAWHRQRLKMSLRQIRKKHRKNRQKPQKKWRNLHNYHVIIFYLIYVHHLIENIFRTISCITFRTIEKLFFVLSYFRFYEMNFFHWNLMTWEAFIPKYSVFFRVTHKNFQPDNFPGICQTENFCASLEKIRNILE